MSQVITLSTRTTKAYPRTQNEQNEIPCVGVYVCHHRFHLHIAIKLEGKKCVKSCPSLFSHHTTPTEAAA